MGFGVGVNWEIRDNVIINYDRSDYAIQCARECTLNIHHNLIESITTAIRIDWNLADEHIFIVNNTISYRRIGLQGDFQEIRNNIFIGDPYSSHVFQIFNDFPDPDENLQYNTFYYMDQLHYPGYEFEINETNVVENPLFRGGDPLFDWNEEFDYRLLANSPCIDSGDPDILDPDGTISDRGAYFYDQFNNEEPALIFPECVVDKKVHLSGTQHMSLMTRER